MPRGWIGLSGHWALPRAKEREGIKVKVSKEGGSAWVAAWRGRSGCKATGTGTLAQVPSSVNASQRRTTPTMDRRHYTATLGTRER